MSSSVGGAWSSLATAVIAPQCMNGIDGQHGVLSCWPSMTLEKSLVLGCLPPHHPCSRIKKLRSADSPWGWVVVAGSGDCSSLSDYSSVFPPSLLAIPLFAHVILPSCHSSLMSCQFFPS